LRTAQRRCFAARGSMLTELFEERGDERAIVLSLTSLEAKRALACCSRGMRQSVWDHLLGPALTIADEDATFENAGFVAGLPIATIRVESETSLPGGLLEVQRLRGIQRIKIGGLKFASALFLGAALAKGDHVIRLSEGSLVALEPLRTRVRVNIGKTRAAERLLTDADLAFLLGALSKNGNLQELDVSGVLSYGRNAEGLARALRAALPEYEAYAADLAEESHRKKTCTNVERRWLRGWKREPLPPPPLAMEHQERSSGAGPARVGLSRNSLELAPSVRGERVRLRVLWPEPCGVCAGCVEPPPTTVDRDRLGCETCLHALLQGVANQCPLCLDMGHVLYTGATQRHFRSWYKLPRHASLSVLVRAVGAQFERLHVEMPEVTNSAERMAERFDVVLVHGGERIDLTSTKTAEELNLRDGDGLRVLMRHSAF
jgi:hypothetical protein